MLAELNRQVLVCDLDPQANLTAAFLSARDLVTLLEDGKRANRASTIFQCVEPLTEVGDLKEPDLKRIAGRIAMLPGDLALSGFEDQLSSEWPASLGSANPYRPFRVLSAFCQV